MTFWKQGGNAGRPHQPGPAPTTQPEEPRRLTVQSRVPWYLGHTPLPPTQETQENLALLYEQQGDISGSRATHLCCKGSAQTSTPVALFTKGAGQWGAAVKAHSAQLEVRAEVAHAPLEPLSNAPWREAPGRRPD